MANILMIVAPENFRDEEFLEPKKVFEESGAEVTVASKGVSTAKGMMGATTKVDMDISEVKPTNYDAVVFVGGAGASIYFDDDIAQSIAKTAYESGRVVAAICIAPSTLANAGLLKGKKATCWESEAFNLKSKGADYTEEGVTQDGKIITGKGPQFAKEFGQKVADNLG